MANKKEDQNLEEQKHEALTEFLATRKKEIEDRKASELEAGFLNPLGEGTSYAEFKKAVSDTKKSVAEYCKAHLDKDTIAWIEKEINLIK